MTEACHVSYMQSYIPLHVCGVLVDLAATHVCGVLVDRVLYEVDRVLYDTPLIDTRHDMSLICRRTSSVRCDIII
jgi:hypothetical protein